MDTVVLLSGTSNQPLALALAKDLHMRLGEVEITRFIDSECRVYVKEGVQGKDVFILDSLSQIADQFLVELCLLGQAVKQLGAHRMIAVIPWMGYSKQDKEFRRGEAISAQLVAKFIEAAGFSGVITSELHSENVKSFFHIPVEEVLTHELLAGELKKNVSDLEESVVVAPDKGGVSRSTLFARVLGLPVIHLVKERDTKSGAVSILGADGDVGGKNVVIFDDIINIGGTAIKTSEFVKAHGANRVYFLATHAVLAGDASSALAGSTIDQVIVTDTIATPAQKQFAKLTIVSVAPLLAQAIKEI